MHTQTTVRVYSYTLTHDLNAHTRFPRYADAFFRLSGTTRIKTRAVGVWRGLPFLAIFLNLRERVNPRPTVTLAFLLIN